MINRRCYILKVIINTISGILIYILSFLFGSLDASIIILAIVIGLDYLTGVCKAIYNRNFSSFKSIKGIIKKIGYFLIVILGAMIDKILGDNYIIRNIIIYFFISNEGISILENWALLGLPIPKKLYDSLLEIQKSNGDNDE